MPGGIYAVVPAAGCGLRFGAREPKQYAIVGGFPLIYHTVRSIARLPEIVKIVLVVDDPDKVTQMSRGWVDFPSERVALCRGGSTRHRSIKAGLDHITGDETTGGDRPELVMIHDGARPLLPAEPTRRLFETARESGAAGFYLPLVSTLLEIDEETGEVKECVKRSKYVASETPQAFKFDVICEAYRKCSEEDLEFGTECLDLVVKNVGVVPRVLPGTWELFKVTHRKDIDSLADLLDASNGIHEVTKISYVDASG